MEKDRPRVNSPALRGLPLPGADGTIAAPAAPETVAATPRMTSIVAMLLCATPARTRSTCPSADALPFAFEYPACGSVRPVYPPPDPDGDAAGGGFGSACVGR